VKAEIRMQDNIVQTIFLEDVFASKRGLNTIRQFLFEQNLKTNSKPDEKGLFYDMLKNKILTQGGIGRVKIETRSLSWDIRILTDDINLSLSNDGQIRLVSRGSKNNSTNVDHTILSVRVKGMDVGDNSEIQEQLSNNKILDHWLRSKPLSLEDFLTYTKGDKPVQEWIAKRMRERATGKYGLTFSLPSQYLDLSTTSDSTKGESELLEERAVEEMLESAIPENYTFFEEAFLFEDEQATSREVSLASDEILDDVDKWMDAIKEGGMMDEIRDDLQVKLYDQPGFTNKMLDEILDFCVYENARMTNKFLSGKKLNARKFVKALMDSKRILEAILDEDETDVFDDYDEES
jgi:hypothetical protein